MIPTDRDRPRIACRLDPTRTVRRSWPHWPCCHRSSHPTVPPRSAPHSHDLDAARTLNPALPLLARPRGAVSRTVFLAPSAIVREDTLWCSSRRYVLSFPVPALSDGAWPLSATSGHPMCCDPRKCASGWQLSRLTRCTALAAVLARSIRTPDSGVAARSTSSLQFRI